VPRCSRRTRSRRSAYGGSPRSRQPPSSPCFQNGCEKLARFALATGLRQANVLGLEWTQVDLVRRVAWIHPDQAKARRAIGVPLNEDAVGVILRQRGKHLRRVFVDAAGKPMDRWPSEARKAWEAVCAQLGHEDFRWHDLRHTWASWHVQRGTPLYVLKELGGWRRWRWCRSTRTSQPNT